MVKHQLDFARRVQSSPGVRAFLETVTLHSHDTEALARRSSHDHPSIQATVDCRSKPFEPLDFGRDIVRLDVDVDAALMVYSLDLDADLAFGCREHAVVSSGSWMIRIDRSTECFGPKPRGGVNIVAFAVDEDSIES
jgi:hypothetical protein